MDECAICKEEFPLSKLYEYRGVVACEDHIDELRVKREDQRQRVIETLEKSIRSQADGKWMAGGYKTMKTEGGKPVTEIKPPQQLTDYEDGKL